MKINNLNIINITPTPLQCIAAACPTIFKTDKGSYIIVGRKLGDDELNQEIKNKIGAGEIAVEIPQELLGELNK